MSTNKRVLLNSLVILGCLLLVACGSGEQLLRSIVNDLDEDFVDEMNAYARLDAQQKLRVNRLSKKVKYWVQTQQLPKLRALLADIAGQMERAEVVDQASYLHLFDFLSQPFSFADSDPIMAELAGLAYSLSPQQVQQVGRQQDKEWAELARQSRKKTLKQENKEIIQSLQYVLRDLGVHLDSDDQKYLFTILATRQSVVESILQAQQNLNQQFRQLLELLELLEHSQTNNKIDAANFKRQFVHLWRQSESLHQQVDPAVWQHNRQLMVDMLDMVFSQLNAIDKQKLVRRLKDYIVLLDELSQVTSSSRQ